MSLNLLPPTALTNNVRWFVSQAKAPVVRPISQWVEESIILPNGPYAGERYRHHRHPVSRPWFDAIDSGLWSRFAATGPTQNGKTLMCYVAPLLYHVFEIGETAIVGLPNMDMAGDKWEQDFRPVIEASEYRHLLPLTGEGSRGGQVKRSITFRNGATLRFMSAGGNDKKRAGYTSRVLGITETDGMDESGQSSREADKIEQLEGRTRAYGRTGKRIYLECTASTTTGRIWTEIKAGTDSKLVRQCPHCQVYVTPEREHLAGWEGASSEEQAAEQAFWSCPACGQAWTEADRASAALSIKLIHRGQTVTKDGEVIGEAPATQTLGFRWSAIDNPFVTAADLGAEEWLAKRQRDRDNAERKMKQFVFSLPHDPPDVDLTPLDMLELQNRTAAGGRKRGVLPPGCIGIVVGVDTGKRILHWEAKAICSDGSKHVIDYGKQTVDSERLGVYAGLIDALNKLKLYFDQGWGGYAPVQVWIDSGYHEHTNAVYAFCAGVNANAVKGAERYRPIKGYGEGQRNTTRYREPSKKTKDVLYVGRQFYISMVRRNGRVIPGVFLVHVNSDYWKSELFQALLMPTAEPGCTTIFDAADDADHAMWAAHHTAEKQKEKFVEGRGVVTVFERIDRDNHLLDAGYLATAAGEFVLASRAAQATKKPAGPRKPLSQLGKRTV